MCPLSIASGSTQVIFPLYSALGRHICNTASSTGVWVPVQERQGHPGASPAKGHQDVQGVGIQDVQGDAGGLRFGQS